VRGNHEFPGRLGASACSLPEIAVEGTNSLLEFRDRSALAWCAVGDGSDPRRKASFDRVPELYDAARPEYPPELIEALIELAELRPGGRVLEIGPGTGQLTIALAQRGMTLTAIELGVNLAALLRRQLARFAHAEVVNADFEAWPVPEGAFDLVVAATAFHWLDPSTRVRRCASALRPGSALAIIETRWGIGCDDDPFFRASQSCYARWDPDHDPAFRPRSPDELPVARDELIGAGLFANVSHRRWLADRVYDVRQYRDLLGTFSSVLVLDELHREGLLACISQLVETQFAGSITRCNLYDLSVARLPN
jgi:SAM-dependent methyltransferase